ncbi:transketolase [Candidatus Woesearchaeota archaeon]|nr:transketolase [Candidatus Woesearchaeota archaeon]
MARQNHALEAMTADELRKDILKAIHDAGSGHPGGSLSIIDTLHVLYTHTLNHKPKQPRWAGRDRVVLSAGHTCPALYAELAHQGYYGKKQLDTLRKFNSKLQGHPEAGLLPGIEATSGPLGQGYALAVGKAMAAKKQGKQWKVYCISSDGEHDEGVVWEAAQIAAHQDLGNLVVIIDRNDIQIDGHTRDILDLRDLREKYEAFGWHVLDMDGHNHRLINDTLRYAATRTSDKPTCIIAHTILGKGVSFMEGNPVWHGKAPNEEELAQALKELEKRQERRRLKHRLERREVLR